MIKIVSAGISRVLDQNRMREFFFNFSDRRFRLERNAVRRVNSSNLASPVPSKISHSLYPFCSPYERPRLSKDS